MVSSRQPTTACYATLITLIVLLLALMTLLAVLVNQGLEQEELNRLAGSNPAVNCTLLSKELNSQEFNSVWWLASYLTPQLTQQSQLVYYNSVTDQGLDLTSAITNLTITCYCTSAQSPRCVLWSPTQRTILLDNLIIGLALTLVAIFFTTVLFMSLVNTFLQQEPIQFRLRATYDSSWLGWASVKAEPADPAERQAIIQV